MDRNTVDVNGLDAEERRDLLRHLRDVDDRHLDMAPAGPSAGDEPLAHPVSYPQQRLWFMQRLSPAARAYHVESVTPIEGPLDDRAVAGALNAVASRHAVLRTTYREVRGEPWQVVNPQADVPMTRVDLSAMPAAEMSQRVEELLRQWSYEPFDLETGPLFRAALVRLSPTSHLLGVYLHHILADGWSMGILGRDLDALYREQIEGRPADLPPLPLQYTDFAAWQRRFIADGQLDGQLAYWREALDDLATLDLPSDRIRPPVQDHRGGHVDLKIDRDLHDRIVNLGAEEGATPFMTLLAAYAALLNRWSGHRDLPIGTYLANRRRPEFEPLVGFFLNTLVLRVHVDPDQTFRSLIRSVKEVALSAYDHQDVPFELVVEALAPPRDLSRNPLFQAVFQLNNQPTQDPRGNTVEAARARRDAATFDLGLMMFETADGLGGQFEYAASLFDEATIEALADHLLVLLEGAVAEPDSRIADLPVMRPAQITAVVREPNRTAKPYQWDRDIVEMFRHQVGERPDAIAFGNDRGTVTYAQLDAASSRVAQTLLANGIAPGDNVGLQVDRSIAAPAAVLGILKTGAAWVPLDVSWPAQRRTAMCEAAGVGVVLLPASAEPPAGTIPVDLAQALSTGPTDDPGIRLDPANPAYFLGTSGSTGAPKAVASPHGQVLNRLHWMWEAYPWAAGERSSMKTSMTFVDSIWELFGGVLKGTPTWVVPPEIGADVRALVASLRQGAVTRLWLVPSLLRSMLDEFSDLGQQLPALRFWVSSGEDLPLDLYRRFTMAAPQARLFNLYGTTELWDATWCDPEETELQSRVPIGRAISNVRIYVLDEQDRPVPFGWPGMLHAAGAGLALGYCGNRELQEQAFRRIEIEPGHTERLYCTGDRVVLRRDHHVEFLGRSDSQVKIRGVRVEPTGVENVLGTHPAVGLCAVRTVSDDDEVQLVAWYEPIGEPVPDRDLRAHLRAILPSAAIPSRFIVVDPMPRTTSGKVDRPSLSIPRDAAGIKTESEPPTGPLEQKLALIWSELLGGIPVGRDDDFFADLGGHSLLGVRALSRLRDESGIDLPLRWLFEYPTVRALADVVETRPAPATSSSEPIPRLERTQSLVDM